jgi:hypothetical protein
MTTSTKNTTMGLAIAAGLAMCAGATANAAQVTAMITADNHYSLYSKGGAGTLTLLGGNELGAGGAPGTYNWSKPEPHNFTTSDYFYIAAWSDNSVAQGLLAQVTIDGQSFDSGNPAWQVYPTFIDRGDGSAHPSAAVVAGYVATADSGNLWQTPFVGGANGIAPWGTVPGINSTARWTWINNPNQSNPLSGGSGYGETLIFRIPVPAPGAAAVLGLGGLIAARRRRA